MKGLYILISVAICQLGAVKLGMSMHLERRMYDSTYRTNFPDAHYAYFYRFNNKYKKKEILYIEGLILKKTEFWKSNYLGTEYRQMTYEELDEHIRSILDNYKISYKRSQLEPILKKPVTQSVLENEGITDNDSLDQILDNVPESLKIDLMFGAFYETGKPVFHHRSEVKTAVVNILNLFKTNDEVLLIAEPQSGKTDAILRLAEVINTIPTSEFEKRFGYSIMHIYIIICTSRNELKNDIKNKTYELYKIPLYKKMVTITHIGEYKNLTVDQYIKIAQDFEDALIIFDESHCDTNKKSIQDNLKESLNYEELKIPHKILDISATPYEYTAFGKIPYVFMQPGENYYGVNDMLANNRIYQSKPLSNYKNMTYFNDKIRSVHGNDDLKKYIIVRLPRDLDKHKSIKNNFEKFFNQNIKTVNYFQDNKNDINDMLNIEPEKLTVIFVKDKLRMGKSIITKHICALIDSPNNQYVQTTVQGFVGRAAGYNKKDHNVIIFTDKQKVFEHKKWFDNNLQKEYLPRSSKNVKNGQVSKNSMFF